MEQKLLSKNSVTCHSSELGLRAAIRFSGLLLLILLSVIPACAAAPAISAVGDNHTRWEAGTGFTGGHVYSITQTSDGYLWIGTSTGLVRFDGFTFVPLRPDASEASETPSIVGVATDLEGNIWASNGLEAFRLQNGKLKSGLPGQGPQQPQDTIVANAPNGALLFAAGFEGIFSYVHGRATLLVPPGEVASVPISLAQGANGTLWVGTHTGLFYIKPGAGVRLVRRIEGLPDTTVNSLLPMVNGGLLIGTNRGLWSWDGSSVTRADVAAELKERQILALAMDLEGSVWVGTEAGLFKAEANHIDSHPNLQLLERLPGTQVATALFQDREGNMWVGGLDGIERYRANAFTTYSFSSPLPLEHSGPIFVDQQLRTWFAPSGAGLFWFRRNLLEVIDCDGLKGDGVYSIAGGGDEVWAGRKRGGLTQVRISGSSTNCVTYNQRSGLAEDAIYSVYRSTDGTVWAGSVSQGLTRLQHGSLKTFTVKDGLPSNTISAIAGSGSDHIFVGTPNGVGELRDSRWTVYTTRDGLPPGAVDSLFIDTAGTLWVGTTKGLAFFQSGRIQVPAKIPDALSEDILGIAESEGWLWISTPSHVLRVKQDALRKGILKERDYREYGEGEGLASVEGVKRTRSVVEDELGRIWFSLNRGISVVQPRILRRQSASPLIRVEGMIADDKVVNLGDKIRLAPGRRRITFHFASVNLTNPAQIRFRYRLDDYDATWSETATIREASYPNLPPGHFRFRVVACNQDGLWSSTESSVSFQVDPAYWQNHIFQFAVFVVFCLLAAGVYRLRLLQLTRRLNLRFEERLAERTRIGRELHDTLLQNLTGLSLQISGMAKIVKEPLRAAEGLQQLKRQAEDCVRETRQSVWDIRSADAEVQDLPSALNHSGQQLTAGKPTQFEFTCEGEPRELPSEVRQQLLRIAREAIGNAVQHAAPKHIRLKLTFGLRQLQLTISDDGAGFDTGKRNELAGHFGLVTMKERAKQVKGSIQILSTVGQGTSIVVRIPGKRGGTR
jgi:signal transduction histidine kinase/ligand-binding sensor domain-containing protein